MVQRKTGVGKLIESKQNQDSSRVNLEEQAKGRQLVGEARSRLLHTGVQSGPPNVFWTQVSKLDEILLLA